MSSKPTELKVTAHEGLLLRVSTWHGAVLKEEARCRIKAARKKRWMARGQRRKS